MVSSEIRQILRRSKWQERRVHLITLLGGCCSRCSENSIEKLEFDHIDRSKKSFGLSGANFEKRMECLVQEAKKCQILCMDCHIAKTKIEMGYRPKPEHGTPSMYTNQKCRCEPCKKAWAESRYIYLRRYRENGRVLV